MVAEAAAKRGGLTSQYIRQAVYGALRADGYEPTAIPANGNADGAGPDSWALVDGSNNVLGFGKFDAKPADDDRGTWLPMIYADAAPFDPDKHYRLAPDQPFVEGNKVIRRYPVIDKGEAV
ncbi:hypothetical protein LMTR13_20850 [Bradyrhizobium icense]|uniref:Uncharacterized protein n=2 Tax=Bradyrhizobium icense TaxID=1274631 RepID=A0A1B1UHM6_9BRAD|nr:hypothetical protein LMTR13_20850 [Bradyrhizobium icense]